VETVRTDWLDDIIEQANLPQLTDIGGGLIIFNNCTCSSYTLHAFRRFPIHYQLFGRERRYRVEDVVAYARRCLEEAPVRVPPQRPRRKRIRPATPGPTRSPPDAAVRQHESGDQGEKVSEVPS
jgi:hypothetical protein